MKRRHLMLTLLGVAAAPVAVLQWRPRRRRRLIIDPEGDTLVYEDGWIVRRR